MADKVLHTSALAICQEAMTALRQEQRLSDISPTAASKVERACYYAYERSRLEVLSSFGWSFIKEDVKVRNGARTIDSGGRYRIAYPSIALKVLQCYDEDGHKVDYTVRQNKFIYSLEPIARITYIFDEEDMTVVPPLVREAIVMTLAKNLCMEITGRANDCQMMEMKARTAVQVARTDDARHGATGSSVYGKNYLYEVMVGHKNPFRRKGL